MRRALAALALLVGCPAPQGPRAVTGISAARLEADTRALAADAFAGRRTGEAGHRAAAAYVAAAFARAGLRPAWPGFLAEVPLRQVVRDAATLTIDAALDLDQDFTVFGYGGDAAVDVTAPLVYLGFGIDPPADVRGAIAVVFDGAPATLPPLDRALAEDLYARSARLAARGAVGLIVVASPALDDGWSWDGLVAEARRGGMRWMEGATPGSGMRVPTAWITAAAFDRLAHGDGAAWWTAALAGQARPRALGLTAHLTIRSTFIARSSPNVGGLVRGATLPDEIVVVTAHLDHLGVDASGAVYPGAVDNASGVAVLLELGRALAAGPPPARSILLLATTGEEEGLLGADYFVHHPTLRAGQRVVAAINLDGVNPRRAVHDVIVLGAEAGPLATAARAASRVTGLALSPADADDARYWIRSDQLPFVRAGIPAVWPFAGAADAGGDRAANDAADRAWVAAHYHQPRDRWEPAYSGAFMVPEAAFALALVRAIAAAP